jgi:hypothetical protein
MGDHAKSDNDKSDNDDCVAGLLNVEKGTGSGLSTV